MHIFKRAACLNFLLFAILLGVASGVFDDLFDSTLYGASLLQTHGLVGDEDDDDALKALYTRDALSRSTASGRTDAQPSFKNGKDTQYHIVDGAHEHEGSKCDVKPKKGASRAVTHSVTVDRSDVGDLVQHQSLFSVQGPCGVSGSCVRSPNYPSNYVDNGDCTISVVSDADLRITGFDTESGSDYLYVNGNRYSGSSNPITSPFRANQSIGWSADHSGTRKGWEICMSGCEAIVYEHGDFTGWEVVLPVGVYDVAAMQARGAGDDAVSSLKIVGHNCRAIAYEHGSFTGWEAAFSTGEFNASAMQAMGAGNDGISSIKVELMPTPSPTATVPARRP